MKILGYIGTYNDKIDQPLQALLDQTYPVNDILVVDNASTEDILPKVIPSQVTVVRTPKNIGPNSAITQGLQYALAHGYDWMWLLESDGAPHKDALEKLVHLYESFDLETKSRLGILGCSQILLPSSKLFQGRLLTPKGPRLPKIDPNLPYCECDSMIWNGCLFNLEAVRAVGLPRCGESGYWEDLSQDLGDTEFTYRIKAAGYKVLVHRFSFVNQRVGRSRHVQIFGRPFISTNHPPSRRYLHLRNLVYFWIYLYPRRDWPMFTIWFFYRFFAMILGVLVMEKNRASKIWASFRGAWDGLTKKLYRRY